MLKLFTDKTFLTDEYRKAVFPLLFDLYYIKSEELLNYYVLVDVVQECDIVVFPVDYSRFFKFKYDFQTLQLLAKEYKKPIWIYSGGDYGFTNHIKNSYTFRLGGFDSNLSKSTFIMPSFINDPYLNYLPQGFLELKKEKLPSIGFVGHAKSGFFKYAKELSNHLRNKLERKLNFILTDKQFFYPSSIKRAKYLHKLQTSKRLSTNFILRNNYRAGAKTDIEKQKSTQEFYNNIFNNAYTFCSRGVGNFSVRFYETLAVGRIPVLLNTDCRLPFNDIIDWNKHIAVLDETKKDSFEKQILDFHNSKTEIEFKEIQKNNRKLWKTYLMRHSYFIKIHNVFFKQIK